MDYKYAFIVIMKRPFGRSGSSSDEALNPNSAPPPPFEPGQPTGIWAMDPFMECDFMAEHYSSDPSPEVFGRSISDAVEEAPPGPVVEPDPVIMELPDSSGSNDVGGKVRFMTMWMRIEEEKKRRAREAAASDKNGAA